MKVIFNKLQKYLCLKVSKKKKKIFENMYLNEHSHHYSNRINTTIIISKFIYRFRLENINTLCQYCSRNRSDIFA